MKILKDGYTLRATFKCAVCTCEYDCSLIECQLEKRVCMTIPIVEAKFACPCCGIENKCQWENFYDPTAEDPTKCLGQIWKENGR